MNRRTFLRHGALALTAASAGRRASAAVRRPPNVLFDNEDVCAIRTQRWKLVVNEYYRRTFLRLEDRGYPQLYDMQAAEPEQYSVAARYPDVLNDLRARLDRATQTFAPYRSKEIPEPWRSIRRNAAPG